MPFSKLPQHVRTGLKSYLALCLHSPCAEPVQTMHSYLGGLVQGKERTLSSCHWDLPLCCLLDSLGIRAVSLGIVQSPHVQYMKWTLTCGVGMLTLPL